ncbi:SUKH-4 family immunity protein [Streptomyces sannanensis]|uniref:SUKH-4 family immunity protein n=1 Tax=Streptomyces sannanensis TaxID=285536 RepID=A0ABP6SAY0_9ACTN
MVTFAQAQERAEEWFNGDVSAYQHREVRVREFELGFVVWAEDRPEGPTSGGGRQRLVIARDSGEATLWPGLPVGEVIRRYEEEYGAVAEAASPEPPARIDLNQTSFLLSPPEWLQDAADRMGIPGSPAEPQDASPGSGDGGAPSSGGARVADAWPGAPGSEGRAVAWPENGDGREPTDRDGVPASSTPWAGTDTNSGPDDASVPLPETVFAPPLSGSDDDAPPHAAEPGARTALLSGGSQLPTTAVAPAVPGAGDIADAVTSKAVAPPRGARGSSPMTPPPPPPPPGAPRLPGATPPGAAGGYVPTQLMSPVGPGAPQPPGPPGVPGTPPASGGGTPARGVHHEATVLAAPGQMGAGPSVPQPPGPPGVPGTPPASGGGTPARGVHHEATVLAAPGQMGAGPSVPQPPGPPGVPPGPPLPPQPPQGQRPQPPASGYPQQPAGQPTVGPGYQAVLRYRAADGTEQQLIRRSAPGTPHPEWQMLHELRAMNVPPQQVLELHTELESCELPGGYCARMIRETWPQVRITSVAPYGTDHASRRQGVQALLTHQGELHQVADGPARPAPVRAPLPQVQPAPLIPPEGIAHELLGAFGPQGVFRFDQRAVSRQGVPDVVGRTLVWAGLPVDMGPFFWAHAVPGQPVPTLAELAQQRGVQPAADAASYLVMGSDFGRAICVQYGTAHIVAVPVEAGPGGQPVPPQFVNSGLPEFVRCLAMLGRMWRLRFGLNPEQAGRWTVDFQVQLAALDPAALASPESWWSVLLEQMWDGLL